MEERFTPLMRIYHDEIPALLYSLYETAPLRRLSDVGMHCGCDYSAFPLFRFQPLSGTARRYTRDLHSMGTALIVQHFTGDLKQSAAGLLHDIATPVFAHVVDFLKGDHIRQEATEEATEEMIAGSPEIMEALHRCGISVEEVSDYHRYPIADNPSPGLSADRLEYTLGNFYCREMKSLDEIRALYESLVCVPNEKGEPELAFTSGEAAQELALGALENARMYTADEDRFCMQYLADLLKKSLEWGVLTPQELYGTEKQVIRRLRQDERAGRLWEEYESLSHIRTADRKPEGCYCVRVPSKLRWIDPLFLSDNGTAVRISKAAPAVRKGIEELCGMNFDVWLYAPEGAEAAGCFLTEK
ncbi:MAG TPA: hypothetical protein H9761_13825 [Candidatus Eisenbergiella merdavium]|uniref:HD domain-containing protein n=1 Tax=Candidatus Eisenbergiella merdavium TaxID=2838551 RepID=A0A9D2NI12_9FIRM|nr:hypothetical protein [Candidatus Eisenbergiella merdavium]